MSGGVTITSRPATITDVAMIMARDGVELPADFLSSIRACKDMSTYLSADDVVAVFGLAPVMTGVGEAWVVFSEHADAKCFGVIRRMHADMDRWKASGCYARIQTIVASDDEDAAEWAESFGAKKEPIALYTWNADEG